MLQSQHLALDRVVTSKPGAHKLIWCFLLTQCAPCTWDASPERGSCRVHSSKGPGPLASGRAAVFSVHSLLYRGVIWIMRHSGTHHSVTGPDRIISKGPGLCFLIWIRVRGLKQEGLHYGGFVDASWDTRLQYHVCVFLLQVKFPEALTYF